MRGVTQQYHKGIHENGVLSSEGLSVEYNKKDMYLTDTQANVCKMTTNMTIFKRFIVLRILDKDVQHR